MPNRAIAARHRAPHPQGFTLIELLVVLVVLAIAAAMVGWSIAPTSGHALESAAEGLATTLEEARWRAIATGRRIAWEAPAQNDGDDGSTPRWYEQTPQGTWQVRVTPGAGTPLAGINATVVLPRAVGGSPMRLELGPEPVGAAACVLLTAQGSSMAVSTDGVAPFVVRRDASC